MASREVAAAKFCLILCFAELKRVASARRVVLPGWSGRHALGDWHSVIVKFVAHSLGVKDAPLGQGCALKEMNQRAAARTTRATKRNKSRCSPEEGLESLTAMRNRP